jgi:HK97 family phage prohead protease
MMERAIVQQYVTGRDGVSTLQACPRPDFVRQMAQRVHRWKDAVEGCQLCQSDNAVSVRGGVAVCGRCKANQEIRTAGFEFHKRVVAEHRATSAEGLYGNAIVFNSLSLDLGGFFERISSRMVDRTLAEGSDVLQLVDHDSAKVIGRLSAGTLRLRKTQAGLANTVSDPPNTSIGRDTVVNVKRRDITGQSFGFMALEDDWAIEGDIVVRTVLDARVKEVSIVTFPAYPGTTIHVGEDAGRRDVDFLRKVHRTRLAR